MRAVVPSLLLLLLASAALPAQALPTPGLFCDTSDAAVGRVFPEAMDSNDFVGYAEARCGLDLLMAENPDMMKIDIVGESAGWDTIAGGHTTYEVFVVRVSNYASALPVDEKLRIVFQLSIHGNEKGGREGGLRVIEDLVRGVGMAEANPELVGYLDYMELLFVFPNPDGWTHEEVDHRAACPGYMAAPLPTGDCVETQNFVRVNGNGFDVNRQWPTIGWVREVYQPMSQPEALALVDYLHKETNVKYASDIHGMLNPADGGPGNVCLLNEVPPEVGGFDPTCMASAVTGSRGHYVLTMLPAGRQNPREMTTNTQLAELVKERLNSDPFFAEWQALPNSAGGAWGGEFNDWGTVWDTIGYTDSGFTSDWYAQDHGLNAAGVDFELAYNHITFDNYYPGLAARMNAYHVETTRQIVRAFMDAANQDLELSIDVKGTKTAYLENPTIVTNAGALKAQGWAQENALDDEWDVGTKVYRAAPNDYFSELRGYALDAQAPAIIDPVTTAGLAERLATYDNLVIAGSAYKTIQNNTAAQAAIRGWVEAGGNLVLTDEAMQMLVPLGLAEEGDVDVHMGYAGATNFVDREHPLAGGIRGLARETYEPVPLGFPIDALSSPIWYVAADGFEGSIVGVAGDGQGSSPNLDLVNFGEATLGGGTVRFLGALLPDPLQDANVFYGLDSYATTYTGNQLLRNMLGWDVTFAQTPVAPEAPLKNAPLTQDEAAAATAEQAGQAASNVPGVAPVLVVAIVAIAALLRRK